MRQVSRAKVTEEIVATTDVIQRLWKTYFLGKLDVLARWSLTPAQLMGLRTIYMHQPINSSKLVGLLHITAGGVTQLVDSLVAAGYVIRQQDDTDRRMTKLGLSGAGEEIMSEFDEKRRRVFIDVFSTLADEELAQMVLLHKKMIDQLNILQSREGEPL